MNGIKAKFGSKGMMSLLWAGLGAGASYWILQLIRHIVELNRSAILSHSTIPDADTFLIRFLFVCFLLFLYSAYAQHLVSRRKRAEKKLVEASTKLEKEVEERTTELSKSNARLTEEVVERMRAEDEVRKVNRALKTLSECNKVIVHTEGESALLDEVCHIIVEVGGYRFAWVGFAEEDANKSVRPVSHAGYEAGYLTAVEVKGEGDNGDRNPVCEAILTGKPVLEKNLFREDVRTPWRAEATKRGYSSLISLPLIANGWTFGALSIYTKEASAFDIQEVNLLKELAGELAFGIAASRTRDEQKQWEAERERLQAQLLQAQKMEAVGTLAGGVAHDFNNLLTTIQGYTEIALLNVDKKGPLHNNLEQVHYAAERAASLTRQLLLFSRKQPMELVPIHVNTTIEGLLKMLKRLIGEDITINTELEDDLWAVRADVGNIEQVFMNLAVNARDAMLQGGVLTIKTEKVTLDDEYCKVIPEARPGKFVCLSVADTGTGMDKSVLQRIFEPFFSTKEFGKGTGLGLAVVYGIVKQHEGWINVYSEPGKGSIFKVYLPASSEAVVEKTEEKISLKSLQGNGERVLLVEDEPAVREFASKVLADNGYVVFDAEDVAEALELFKKEDGKFDLIFSDMVLPDKSGLHLVDRLLQDHPKLSVLLSSGYSDDKSQWPIIEERGFKFLQKPYSIPALLQAIRKTIKSS